MYNSNITPTKAWRMVMPLLLFMLTAHLSSAQTPRDSTMWWSRLDDPTADFNELVAQADSFFTYSDSAEIALSPISPKHFGYWFQYWRHRLDSNQSTRIDGYENERDVYYETDYCTSNSSIPSWSEVGPTEVVEGNASAAKGVGFVNDAWIKPSNHNVMIIGTAGGGVFKTTDGGNSWTDLMSSTRIAGIAVNAIEVNPANENHIYASVGDNGYGLGLIRTTDGGQTWCGTSLTKDPQVISDPDIPIRIVANKPQYFGEAYALTKNDLFRTTNGFLINNLCGTGQNTTVSLATSSGGEDWINLERNQAGFVFASAKSTTFNSGDPNTYNQNPRTLVRYDEGSSQLTDITQNLIWNHANTIGYTKLLLCVASDRPNNVYVLQERVELVGTTKQVYLSMYSSTDNGNNFTLEFDKPVGGMIREDFEASLYHDGTFYASGPIVAHRMVKSGGNWSYDQNWSNWTNLNAVNYAHADVRDIEVVTAQGGYDEVFWSTDGGLFKSVYNVFENVTEKDLSIWMVNGFVDFDGTDEIFCGVYHGGNNFRDKNNKWHISGGGDGGRWAVDDGDHQHLIGGINSYIGKFNRDGDYVGYGPTASSSQWWLFVGFPVETLYETEDSFLIAGHDLRVYDWSQNQYVQNLTSGLNTSYIRDVKCHKDDGDIIVFANSRNASQDSALFKSTNGGQTWVDISTNLNVNSKINSIFMHPDDPDEIWVSFDNFLNGHKVFVTFNNGSSWTGVSTNLRFEPVNDFAYDKVADILYAASDYGVYYLDKSKTNDSWHCYYKNLPSAHVTQIDVNYCTKKLVAATSGRGFHHVDLYQINEHTNPTKTWTNTSVEAGEEFYSSGSINVSGTVTIKGSLYMHEDAFINVQPNSKLIVDGGTITNSCGGLWGGIRAWGAMHANETNQRPFSQYDESKHGVVEIKNGALIENAHTGVLLGRDDLDYRKGGIVRASNSEFRNNYRSIRFMSYHNHIPVSPYTEVNNRSTIKNCSFLTTDTLEGGQYTEPNAQIHMHDIKGLYIKASTFADSTPWNSPYRSNNGAAHLGIKSYDATFSVDPVCGGQQYYYINNACWNQSNADSNTFYGYMSAINVENYNGVSPVTVRGARFINNKYPFVVWSGDMAEIYKNDFIHSHTSTTGALYMIGSTGYFIEENNFEGTGSNYGLIVSNSGGDPNEVRNNYFEDLGTACQIQGVNDAFGDDNGLHYMCNEMVNTGRDISVYGGDIALFQGHCTSGSNSNSTPANNIFSSSCYGVSHFDVYKPSSQPIYYATLTGGEPTCYSSYVYFNNFLTNCGSYIEGNGQQCPLSSKVHPPSHFDAIADRFAIISDFIHVVDSMSDTLDYRIVNDDNNIDVVDALKNAAPLLKDSTLMLAISGKPTEIPDDDLLSVLYLVAPLSEDVNNVLHTRNPSLCDQVDAYVEANNILFSPTRHAYLGVYQLQREIKKSQEEILRYYLSYDTLGGLDSALLYLKTLEGEDFLLTRFRLLLRMDSISAAEQLLADLDRDYNADGHLNDFLEWGDISVDLAEDSSGVFLLQTNSTLEQRVRALADTTKLADVNFDARALLSLVFDEPQSIPPTYDTEGSPGSNPYSNNNTNSIDEFDEVNSSMFKLYPNPTRDHVVIDLNLPDEYKDVKIVVYNIQGQKILSQEVDNTQKQMIMDTSKLMGGMYIYLLNADGEFVARRRLIISQ